MKLLGIKMKITFNSSEQGLEKIIGRLERSILDILWENQGIPGREIHQRMLNERKLAYTTTLTILDRMVKKGSALRKKEGSLFLYYPSMKKEEFEQRVASTMIRGIYEMAPSPAISAFVEILSSMDESEINEIISRVEKKKGRSR
jgi:predicted transcriptional regulator